MAPRNRRTKRAATDDLDDRARVRTRAPNEVDIICHIGHKVWHVSRSALMEDSALAAAYLEDESRVDITINGFQPQVVQIYVNWIKDEENLLHRTLTPDDAMDWIVPIHPGPFGIRELSDPSNDLSFARVLLQSLLLSDFIQSPRFADRIMNMFLTHFRFDIFLPVNFVEQLLPTLHENSARTLLQFLIDYHIWSIAPCPSGPGKDNPNLIVAGGLAWNEMPALASYPRDFLDHVRSQLGVQGSAVDMSNLHGFLGMCDDNGPYICRYHTHECGQLCFNPRLDV